MAERQGPRRRHPRKGRRPHRRPRRSSGGKDDAELKASARRAIFQAFALIFGGDGWPTISATAGSTTCWPAARTSTSSSSTPRFIPPAASLPRPRLPCDGAVRRQRQDEPQEGSGPHGHELRQRVRGADRHGRQSGTDLKAISEAEAYPGLSSSSPTSHAEPRHQGRPRQQPDAGQRAVEAGYWSLHHDPRRIGQGARTTSYPRSLPTTSRNSCSTTVRSALFLPKRQFPERAEMLYKRPKQMCSPQHYTRLANKQAVSIISGRRWRILRRLFRPTRKHSASGEARYSVTPFMRPKRISRRSVRGLPAPAPPP